jgi:acetylornithine deacetylase
MSVTLVNAGTQHNVVPDRCSFVIDIRVTDAYSNEEVIAILKENLQSEVKPRSLRLNSSSIEAEHPFVVSAKKHNTKTYGSPTMSDQALMPWTSVKMGPGDSARSHSADEFIYVNEISEGIEKYIAILEGMV